MARGKAAIKSGQRFHAYLQVRKLGRLCGWSNYNKGGKFICEANWTLGWWQLGKIATASAKLEIVDNKHHVESTLKQLEFHESKAAEAAIVVEQQRVRSQIARKFTAYKQYPQISEWMAQYGPENYGSAVRFKFLVIVGESRWGKTQMALSLFGRDSTLYANCQNVDEPGLAKFARGCHRAVLCDEATPKMVLRNKVLFQCNAEGVTLQESRCNQHTVWKWLYMIPMVICCNHWDLAPLSAGDRS